jgi:lipopolysaccharide export system protein LptA
MKILFDPKARKITRAVAIGNVIIKREGNTTRSERAIYTVKDGRIRLIGKPRIIVN